MRPADGPFRNVEYSPEAAGAAMSARPHGIKLTVPFNRPDVGGEELEYVRQSLAGGKLSGDGPFTARCRAFLETIYGSTVLLMHSCTAALEAAALLVGIEPGDEVVMPSFTFVSTANAVVLRGGVPVFVDIRPDTLNLDEHLIEAAITPRTRAIMPVHYAGIGADMATIGAIAERHGLAVIEDAAQGFGATLGGRPLGSFGALGCISFHDTKNIVSGEGGALVLNDPALVERAQIIREKGTNRTRFLQGRIDKYEWVDIGSSLLPSDLLAAVLLAQLEKSYAITEKRRHVWERYDGALRELAPTGRFSVPTVPADVRHNGHIYYLVAESAELQAEMRRGLREDGVEVSPHYVPLHASPAGRRYGRVSGALPVTERIASRLIRLPLHAQIGDTAADYAIDRIRARASVA